MVKVQLERLLNSADVLKRNCLVDYMVRIEDKDMNIYSCENCLFREKLDSVVCPYRMMNTRGRRVLL